MLILFEKVLDRCAIDTLYKAVRAMSVRAVLTKKNHVEEQEIQRTFDAMAAARRHVHGRVFIRPELASDRYFWR